MKKIFKSLTACLLAFLLVGVVPLSVFAEGGSPTTSTPDTTPPVLKNIFFDSSAKAGDSLSIKIEATDDISQIQLGDVTFVKKDTLTTLRATFSYSTLTDGYYQALLELSKYASAGEYLLSNVYLKDKAGNFINYYGIGEENYNYYTRNKPEVVIPDTINQVLTVTNDGEQDKNVPTIKKLVIDTPEIRVPGDVKVTAIYDDDLSGVRDGMVTFGNGKGWITSSNSITRDKVDGSNEVRCVFSIHFDELVTPGEYGFYFVSATDNAGNGFNLYGSGVSSYADMLKNNPKALLPEEYRELKVTVLPADGTPPTLTTISFDRAGVSTPATVKIKVDANDDYGVKSAKIWFEKEGETHTNINLKKMVECKPDKSGNLVGALTFGMYDEACNYVIYGVAVTDNNGNTLSYKRDDNNIPAEIANLKIRVMSDNQADKVTNVDSVADALAELKTNPKTDSEGNAVAAVVVAAFDNSESSNAEVSKAVFDTIAETGATVDFTSNGITWEFNGAELKEKQENGEIFNSVPLTVSIKDKTEALADASEKNNVEKIEKLAGTDNNALILNFDHSGDLPGTAKIRVKADYALQEYLGQTGLTVYYWDSKENKLVEIAKNVSITEDCNIEFEITHCSYYIVTAKAATNPDGNKTSGGSGNISYGGGGSSYSGTASVSTPAAPSGPETPAAKYAARTQEVAEVITKVTENPAAFGNVLKPGTVINLGGGTTVTAETRADGTTQTVINYSSGDSLPNNIMASMSESENTTLVFSYVYEGQKYKIEITSEEAAEFFDPEIKWYGPLWLYGHFSEEAKAARKAAKAAEAVSRTYTIKSGDSLNAIAAALGTTVDEICKKNDIKNPNVIYAGQTINY